MPRKKKSTKTVRKSFTFPTHADPNRSIPGTEPYLDDLTRENAETARAKAENREPDYENASATQGTPLLPTNTVKANLPGDWKVEKDVDLKVAVGEEVEYEEDDDTEENLSFNLTSSGN